MTPDGSRQIRVTGLSHHTAPLEIREKVAFRVDDYGPTLRHLTAGGTASEGVLLSTCNRSEWIAVVHPASNGHSDDARFRDILHQRAGTAVDEYLFTHDGDAAVEHVFRVAASLDSMVIGEAQILGQVNEAFDAALEAGTTGPITDRLFARARLTAKRVRSETGIGQLKVSVSSVAVELAEKIFSSLAGRAALVVGAGDTGFLTLQHMVSAGIHRAYVTNRTERRADEAAASVGAVAVPFENRFELLKDVDIVISATGADALIFRRTEVASAMAKRKHRPIFLIDLAVPRDIDPECAEIDGVFLYNVDDLKQVVERNTAERAKEAERARAIVSEEAARFLAWLDAQHTVPTVVALRRRIEEIQRAEQERFLAKSKHLSAADRAAVEAYGASIVNKILHSPTVRLKDSSDPRQTARLIEAVRTLFHLDEAFDEDEGRHEESKKR